MITRNDTNFFKAHFDALVLVAGLLALALAGYYAYTSYSVDPEEEQAEAVRKVEGGAAAKAVTVKAVDLASYASVTNRLRKPEQLAALKEKAASFLASEARVYCAKCHAAIPPSLKECPACHATFAEEIKVVYDTDNDGLPDAYETQVGLNPKDPADAALDTDNDLFTNLEEYQAKTNPKDPASHPDYLDFVELRLPLAETFLPFLFEKVMETPSGVRFYFKAPKLKNDYGKKGRTFAVLAGEAIGETGFVAKEYRKDVQKVAIKGSNVQREKDCSVAVVERASDKRQLTLKVGDKKFEAVDVQATLVFTRDGEKAYTVVPGDTIDLHGTKAVVKSIVREGKGATVELEIGGRAKKLTALEQ